MDTIRLNPITRTKRRYLIEFAVSMIAYVLMVLMSSALLHGPLAHAPQLWRILTAMSPLIAIAFTLAAIVRYLRGVDELMLRMQMEALAVAGAVIAVTSVTYGLGETEGLPHLSAWWTYTVFMLAWGAALPFVRRRYR